MELGLSLGDPSKPSGFLTEDGTPNQQRKPIKKRSFDLDFCMGLSLRSPEVGSQEGETKAQKTQENDEENDDDDDDDQISEGDMDGTDYNQVGTEKIVQLNLLPLAPVPRQIPSHLHSLPWSSDNGSSENGSSGNVGQQAARILDVNRLPVSVAEEVSSANGVGSPFHMEFGMYRNTGDGNLQLSGGNKRGFEACGNDVVEGERASSRASDDDENGLNSRKKLRLSKEQSAFLEESFKERNTLNPKQKLELAKQLNLRPRQVEVWFQNRRARTKLKQTEVDCEYLKGCCETLSEENRRLHKELQELRALKASNPFHAQLPATTLTMCPSCKRVATAPPPPTTTTNTAITVAPCATDSTTNKAIPFPQTRAIIYPFSPTPTLRNRSAAK